MMALPARNGLRCVLYLLLIAALPLHAQSNAVTTVDSKATNDVSQTLTSLRTAFADIKSVQTRFTERKRLSVFEQTIEIKGTLALESGGKLLWRTESPIRYALLLSDGYAHEWDEESDKTRKTKTTGNPMFEQVLDQIGKWFSGEFITLTEEYELELVSQSPLRLSFTPRTDSMTSKAVKRITVRIRDDRKYVEQITIEDVSGDTTSITFHDTVLNQPIPDSVWKADPGDE